jgi:ketosteroid isomerase-like protein
MKRLRFVMLTVIILFSSGCNVKNKEWEENDMETLKKESIEDNAKDNVKGNLEDNAEGNAGENEGDNPGGNSVTGNPEDVAPMASKAPELDIPYIVNQPLPEIDKRNQAWIQAFHSRDGSLEGFYTDNALLFPAKDRYLQGAASVQDFYKNYGDSFRIKEFRVDYRVQLTENRGMVYETGSFVTDTEEMYQYLTVWTQDDNIWLHELDVISVRDISLTADPLIDTARNQWIELANANSAKKLAKELYNLDFVYYNRGRLYEGYENLADIYSYMDNENYKINLTKDICVMVQPDLAYEIGTWTSAGSGSYLIVWRYTENKWGIHLDTNW